MPTTEGSFRDMRELGFVMIRRSLTKWHVNSFKSYGRQILSLEI